MNFTGERFIPNQTDIELELEHMQRYKFASQFVMNKVVLDAACGEGYGSDVLSNGAKEVYGLDISKETIIDASQKYKKSNLKFMEGSIINIPFEDNMFDIIISYETIEHVDETSQELFMKEAKRALKKGGILIISTPNKSVYSDKYNYHNEFHVKEFYKTEFIQFLRKYFNNVDLCSQYFEVANIIEKKNDIKADGASFTNDDSIAKYYIAICSDSEINDNYSSYVNVMKNNNYSNYIERILNLQDEVEERNNHILNLDENIVGSSKEIERLNSHIDELSKWGMSLDKENESHKNLLSKCNTEIEIKDNLLNLNLTKIETLSLTIISKELDLNKKDEQILEQKKEIEKKNQQINIMQKEIEEKDEQIKQQQINLNNKIGHIELLLESDRELERIHNSTGWKFLLLIYKFEDSIFPINSKRRFLAKLLKKFLKNPKTYLRYINKENIKKLSQYMRSEDVDRVNSRLESFEEKHAPILKEELVIINEEVTDYEKIDFAYENNPLVSIIIPVYNQWNYTYNCLKSIKENTEDVSFEIIIADDLSSDETKNISNFINNIKVVRSEENLGFLLNCNNAAKESRGKYIHFLNNDTNVQKNWLSSLVDLIEKDKNTGMVGSKLVYSNGKLQEAGGIIWNDASGWNYGRLDDSEKPEYNYVKEVDYISGASIMIKRSLWEEIGGFDGRYAPAYFEDSDLAFEVRRHGYKVMYQPKSVVVHFEGISNGTDISKGMKNYQMINQDKFFDKWKDLLHNENYNNAENVFLARDRSRFKKTIIVVDHYVPQYDKDAGSRTIYQYLKLLVEMDYNVKFIGDNFYKHEPYSTELEQMGIEILYGTYYLNHWKDWIKLNSKHIDFVFLNRPHISIKYIDFVKNYTDAKIIYYVLDLHFLREMREYKITGDKNLLKSSNEWKEKELGIMSKSDVVFTLSTDERDIINNELDSQKAVISPIFYFDELKFNEVNLNEKKGIIFVGGFVHKPNEDGVLWFAEKIYPKILKEIPDCVFTIIGSNPTEKIKSLESKNIHVTGYVTDEELLNYYKSRKVCVIPLRFGAGVKGKTIEAMYNMIAIVSTSIGTEGLENICEYVKSADEEDEFANMVIEMYNNNKLNDKIISKYPNYINKYFSHDGALALFKKIFS